MPTKPVVLSVLKDHLKPPMRTSVCDTGSLILAFLESAVLSYPNSPWHLNIGTPPAHPPRQYIQAFLQRVTDTTCHNKVVSVLRNT
jgi:hypothetical protein